MKNINLIPQPLVLALTLVLLIASNGHYPTLAKDVTAKPATKEDTPPRIRFHHPDDHTRRDSPQNRVGAASRGSCQIANSTEQLTALIPQTQAGLTTQKYPTFWFYLPYQSNDFHSLKFGLYHEQQGEIYQTTIAASRVLPGIISFQLPPTATPLETNQDYQWYLSIYCENPDLTDNPQTIYRGGLITRKTANPALARELALATTTQEKAAIYAKYGIWFDSLTLLGNLHRNNTNQTTLNNYWTTLLEDVELDNIANQPIINCCSPSPN